MSFYEDVVRALDSALGRGAYAIEQSLSSESGHDAIVTIRTGNLKVRFVRDRGQIFGEAIAEGQSKRWHDLRTLAKYIQGLPSVEVEGTESLDQNVELLATFRHAMAEILGPGYDAAKHDLFERHRLALGGRIAEWLRDHPPQEY